MNTRTPRSAVGKAILGCVRQHIARRAKTRTTLRGETARPTRQPLLDKPDNESESSNLPDKLSVGRSITISEFGEPITERYITSCLPWALAKGCCETPNFGNWWFEPVFSRRMVPEGVGFGVAGVTAGPATRQDGDHSRWPNSPPAGWTRIDRSQCTAEDQRLPRSSARRRLHASGNRNGERVGCRFCVWGEP